MKVFVAGATGVLGRRVVQRLTGQTISVVALSRSANNSALLKNWDVEIREADLFNKEQLVEATKGCDAILHLATSVSKKVKPRLSDWKLNDKIRIEGTANLIEAAKANGIKRFICAGITGLYAQQNGGWVSTLTPLPDSQVPTVASAISMEKMICDQMPDRSVIIRFGNFYSVDDFHTKNLVATILKGRMPMIGKGDFYTNYIHLDDAADAIVFTLKHFEALKGNIVNATDGKPVLYSEMINTLYSILTNKKAFYLPAFLAKCLIGKTGFAFLTNSYRVGPDPLLNGWKPKYTDFVKTISEAIEQTLQGETR